MSYDVLMIGALHAVPAPLIGHYGQSRIAVLIASVATAIFAVLIGAERYAVVDLLFVAIGAGMGWKLVDNPSRDRQRLPPHVTGQYDSYNFEASVQKMTETLVGEEKSQFESQLRDAYARGGVETMKRFERSYEEGRRAGERQARERVEQLKLEAARQIMEKYQQTEIKTGTSSTRQKTD